MVSQKRLKELKKNFAEADKRATEREEQEARDKENELRIRSLEAKVAEYEKAERIKKKESEKKKKASIGFTKATTSLPDSLYNKLKYKAQADDMSYSDALKILAHRYVAGVIELDKNDAKLVDRYYK